MQIQFEPGPFDYPRVASADFQRLCKIHSTLTPYRLDPLSLDPYRFTYRFIAVDVETSIVVVEMQITLTRLADPFGP